MGNLYVNPQVVKAQVGQIVSASDQADTSATYIDFRASAQTTAKWGEEHGPGAFMTSYAKELDASKVEVMKLKAGLEQFVSTMDSLVKGFKGTDQAAATNLHNAITSATRRKPGDPDGRRMHDLLATVFGPLGAVNGLPGVIGQTGPGSKHR